jgi:hypothetical protein
MIPTRTNEPNGVVEEWIANFMSWSTMFLTIPLILCSSGLRIGFEGIAFRNSPATKTS